MVTIMPEDLEVTLAELMPLFPLHFAELALNQDKVPLDPQFEVYLDKARRGEVLLMVARDAGQLIGYFVGFVAPGLHYKTCLTLIMDIFYVHPDHRGSSTGFKLFRAVEAAAKARGVQRMFVGSKCHKDASWLFEKLGYEPVETFFSTWLGD